MPSFALRLSGTIFVLAVFLLVPPLLRTAQAANVGFRTIGCSEPDKALRFDINVWYPTKKAGKILKFPPWEINGALMAPPLPGHFPLVVLSHPSSGSRFSLHDTAYSLAEAGFIVAAPTHTMDSMAHMPLLFSWEQFAQRTREIPAVIDLLLADDSLGETIDAERIGVLGYGSGGTAALLLGGALPDCSGWDKFCQEKETGIYCNSWAKKRITEKFCSALPLKRSRADVRIRSVVAVSPDFSMLFTEQSLRHFYPPLLLVIAKHSRNNPAAILENFARRFAVRPDILKLEAADDGALMAACPEPLAAELPELCRSVSNEERESVHEELSAALTNFFRNTLITAPATIPAPPDLTPKAPGSPRQPTSGTRRFRHRNNQ